MVDMFRSTISAFLVASLFIWSGCYETVSLTREEYSHVSKYDGTNVLVDSAGTIWKYSFSSGMCTVQHDTLFGSGTLSSVSGELGKANVAIPVSKISLIEVKKLNYFTTLFLAGGFIGVTIYLIISTSPPGATGPSGPSPPNPG